MQESYHERIRQRRHAASQDRSYPMRDSNPSGQHHKGSAAAKRLMIPRSNDSTDSSRAPTPSPLFNNDLARSDDEDADDECSDDGHPRPIVELEIEEISLQDEWFYRSMGVRRPDQYEEPATRVAEGDTEPSGADTESTDGLIQRIQDLHVGDRKQHGGTKRPCRGVKRSRSESFVSTEIINATGDDNESAPAKRSRLGNFINDVNATISVSSPTEHSNTDDNQSDAMEIDP